jgi:hypothetical protein
MGVQFLLYSRTVVSPSGSLSRSVAAQIHASLLTSRSILKRQGLEIV